MSGISKNAQNIMDYLGCPCEHFPAGAEVKTVINAYEDLLAKREIGGYVPLIIGVEEHSYFADSDSGSSSAELQKRVLAAPPVNAQEWFRKILTDWKEDFGENWNSVVGDIAGGEAMTSLSGMYDFRTEKSMECIIAKIPVKDPWEVFAWYPFGGWNECPPPEEMYWIGKYWYEKYGAIPALMTNDVLQFVASPVKDKTAALDLALEQSAFCSDIIFQGVETIGALADSLTQSSVWYFWWD